MTSNNLKYQAYYTKSDPILDYMVGMLNPCKDDRILEPCGGDGAFVDKIIERDPNANIDVFELNPSAVKILNEKYRVRNRVRVKLTDTLLDKEIISGAANYDKIIGNPPYGARNEEDKKRKLEILYPDLYIKESYTLFLYSCIRSLKVGGKLCFIVPDTFLSLHRHESLRRFMLINSKIKEISLFPSSFFPGVNFGYANLCIILLEKCIDLTENMNNIVSVKSNFSDVSELNSDNSPVISIEQRKIYQNLSSSFMFNSENYLVDLINNNRIYKIGDIARCVTGFYSGDDKKYLHPISKEVKNAGKYECVDPFKIRSRPLDKVEVNQGISTSDCMIPVVKGGNIAYIKPSLWYMDWSCRAVTEYRESKKCRFQNSDYYFREGLAIPMIRSSKMTAALIEGRLFDQSIVGVFPHDPKWIKYLLAFFNSAVCSELIKIINPSANNSANYIKKIPFIVPEEEIRGKVEKIVDDIMTCLKKGLSLPDYLKEELDNIFFSIYKEPQALKKSPINLAVSQLVLDGFA